MPPGRWSRLPVYRWADADQQGVPGATGTHSGVGEVMRRYLQGLRPYYRQVLGTVVIGSVCGLIMNTTVVLPPILLGRAIDTVNALANGEATTAAVGLAALAYLGGVLLMETARTVKRWCLERTIPRMRSNIQADAFRGALSWPLARLHTT